MSYSSDTNSKVDNRRTTLELFNQLAVNDPTLAKRATKELVETGMTAGVQTAVDEQESLHTLLSTNASFTEEVSHAIVGETAHDDALSHLDQTNLSRATLYGTKDQMASAPKVEYGAYTPKTLGNGQIQLPAPTSGGTQDPNWWGDNKDNISVIAVLNEVLISCAKASSDFWKNMWNQATQNMMNAIALAKPIATAVEGQWNAQAAGTMAESKMNQSDGITQCIFAVISFGMGMKESFAPKEDPNPESFGTSKLSDVDGQEGTEMEELSNADDTVGGARSGDPASATSSPSAADSESAAARKTEAGAASRGRTASDADAAANARSTERNAARGQRTVNAARGDGSNAAARAARAPGGRDPLRVAGASEEGESTIKKTGEGILERSKTFSSKVWQGFLKGFQMAQGMSLVAQGICGVGIDAPARKDMANAQTLAGQYDATSKEAEMIAQFQNQAFGRAEDIRQGGQQNIDFGMNVLKSAADTITQAVLAQHV